MTRRIFSDAELKEMGVETADLIQQAIDEGDLEKAKKLTRRMRREYFTVHEGYRDIITWLASFIGRRMGEENLYEGMHYGFQLFAELAEMYGKEDIRRRVEMLAAALRGHLTSLSIEEDDEKITMMLNPCPSGGRAILSGSYGPPKDFLKVKKPQVMTFGRDDFPVYCAHCAFQDIIPIEATGRPLWVTVPAENLGVEPCRMVIYKNPEEIPSEYYERFGKRKPGGEG